MEQKIDLDKFRTFTEGFVAATSPQDLAGLDDWHEVYVGPVAYDLNIAGEDYTSYASKGAVYVDVYKVTNVDGKKVTLTSEGPVASFITRKKCPEQFFQEA